jgi:DNA-binding XRE family transcriptional regulator
MLVNRKNVSLHKLFKNKRFKNIENMMLSDRLKELRKQCKLPQRKVAAALDIDTATYCKIEKGNYSPKREQVVLLASILHSKEKELLILWMADQLNEIMKTNKDIAEEAMELVKIK